MRYGLCTLLQQGQAAPASASTSWDCVSSASLSSSAIHQSGNVLKGYVNVLQDLSHNDAYSNKMVVSSLRWRGLTICIDHAGDDGDSSAWLGCQSDCHIKASTAPTDLMSPAKLSHMLKSCSPHLNDLKATQPAPA